MRRLICLVFVINFLLVFLPERSYCYAADSKLEIEWDYLSTYKDDRDLDTASLHILKKISETKNKSIYRGITITRPIGNVTLENQRQSQESSAVGIGPMYMLRTQKHYSPKLAAAFDISGGVILYDKPFPAGGRHYDFMWRLGPKIIYKFDAHSSINVGYMLMHVSNGFKTHNPGYDARGISLGFETKF